MTRVELLALAMDTISVEYGVPTEEVVTWLAYPARDHSLDAFRRFAQEYARTRREIEARQQQTTACPRCGNPRAPRARFCVHCGEET